MKRGTFAIGLALVLVVLVAGGFLLARRATSDPEITLTCVGGSEKTDFMRDPEVVEHLASEYGITVDWRSMGSYDQVLTDTATIEANGWDCLWPSSASAQYVFESTHGDAFPDYRADTVLQSPEVVYAGPHGTQALQQAGLVTEQSGSGHYTLDMHRLLTEQTLDGGTWQELEAQGLQGPVNIASTDPVRSNSGFTLYQLQASVIASEDQGRSPTLEEAREALPTMRQIYDRQGQMPGTSDDAWNQWLTQGAEYSRPLFAGYENQIIQEMAAGSNPQIADQVRILYPQPSIYSDHPLLGITPESHRLIDALRDEEMQRIAWEKYGFRSTTNAGLSNVEDFPDIPLAPQVHTIPATNSDVTLALLECLRDKTQCS